MISNELLEELQKLTRADKLRVIQILAGNLVSEEEAYFTPGTTYEIITPYGNETAAETVLKMLEDDRAKKG
ncbi:hypothetical protein G4Y79_01100 [Phototrophicus methaneseepsis]|uniref:Uncharacterized protein n=1 Tax=Phototrophicus methaneseepsis TaxID=2710758 RepID=A0A7S8E9S5_9CHLR|nr:hypothetical protein [Phototrophicus methaneseepsis]QPC83001.1 hypothetical protein G4Y79_01100 [Phototrophicus methaneseepsis]